MSVRFRLIAASLALAVAAGSVHAQSPLSADQSKQLGAYMQNLNQGSKASKKAPSDTAHAIITPGMLPGNDVATVAAPDQRTLDNLLALTAPDAEPTGMAFGMASGFGVQPTMPTVATWDQQAGRAIVAAFANPDHGTADQVATFAAVPAGNAAFEERVGLARTLFRVDGTEELVRFFVSREHMKLIIQEVARHIDFTKLSETDRVRLATIAAMAQTELEDKILDLNARNQANILTSPELMQLIVAFDIDPQRKMTRMRLNDDGKIDRAAELDLRLAQYTIVKQFESGQ